MKIKVTDLAGRELLSQEFSNIGINDKTYSINFKTTLVVEHSLINRNPYMISFIDATDLGLCETSELMQYNSYNYSASTAFTVDEIGNKKEIMAVNSNTMTFIKY